MSPESRSVGGGGGEEEMRPMSQSREREREKGIKRGQEWVLGGEKRKTRDKLKEEKRKSSTNRTSKESRKMKNEAEGRRHLK